MVKSYDCRIIAQIAMGDYLRPNSSGLSRAMEIDDLNVDDIQDIIHSFAQAAVRAQKAGFDGVQIHAAHNFFLSRCLSPAYNHRRDEYGGSPVKRARIVLDVLQAIKKKSSGRHVTVKINCSDFFADGLTSGESLVICRKLSDSGIDSIEVSGNGTSRPKIRLMENEAYFLNFALALKKQTSTPVILVGGLRSLEVMGQILNETPVEYLSLSRPLIREPDLPNRWQSGDPNPASCISCNGCYGTAGKRCVFQRPSTENKSLC